MRGHVPGCRCRYPSSTPGAQTSYNVRKRASATYWRQVADRFHNNRRMIGFLASRSVLKLHCADDISEDNADDNRGSPRPRLCPQGLRSCLVVPSARA
jgi:hypothetical protein